MIRYFPDELLKKIAPERKIEKLLSGRATLKRAALSFVDDIEFLDRSEITETALKVMKSYKKRIKLDPDAKEEILDDPALLVQRVQNAVVFQVNEAIRDRYRGEFYKWLPSDADEPRPEHQLNYGETFEVGVGEMPGDEPGCRCGMEILVDDSRLDL